MESLLAYCGSYLRRVAVAERVTLASVRWRHCAVCDGSSTSSCLFVCDGGSASSCWLEEKRQKVCEMEQRIAQQMEEKDRKVHEMEKQRIAQQTEEKHRKVHEMEKQRIAQLMEEKHRKVHEMEQRIAQLMEEKRRKVHEMEQRIAQLMEEKSRLIRHLEQSQMEIAVLESKLEAMMALQAQQRDGDGGSYENSKGPTIRLLQTACDAFKAAVTSFSSDLFNQFITKLPNTRELLEDLLLFAPSSEILAICLSEHGQKKAGRDMRYLLFTFILQNICSDILFSGFEMFLVQQCSPQFRKPEKVKKALFDEYKAHRDMMPQQLEAVDDMFAGFLQSKASMFVEKLDRLLFPEAHVPPPCEKQGETIFNMADSEVGRGFAEMTKSAWLLMKLAFSFKPTAEIMRVPTGSMFDAEYMEDMMQMYRAHSGHMDGHEIVTLICFPGFTVRNNIIKAGVCIS